MDGPFHGERISGYILDERLVLATGEYVYVLDGDPKTLYWVEYPVVVVEGAVNPSVKGPHD
jgi:hypothetical protein